MRCVLACTLLLATLLTGCGEKEQQAQQEGVLLRNRYQALTGWSGEFELCAHLGEQVYEFTIDARWEKDGETVLTVSEPEWMAGITARMTSEESVLEYDGAGMTLGTLDGQGLTPIGVIPQIMEEVTRGYIAQCGWQKDGEESLLELRFRNPEREPGEGTEYTLWFSPDTYALRLGEVQVAGTTVLTMTCDDFTMEMNEDEPTDHENLDGDSSGQPGT